MKNESILITGGAGFIGSHCAEYFLQQGATVTVLDNLSSGFIDNLNLAHPNLEFVEGDVLEFPLLKDLIPQHQAVLHLAAIASVPASIENPIYSMQVNTQGFLHVLQAVRETRPNIKIVYASSAAVYGDTDKLPCQEQDPLNPLSPYALQKLQCEQYAQVYERLFGIKSLGMRYFNVFGERQDPNSPYSGVISRFLDLYKQNKQLKVFGDGLQSRDFIHVSDIVKANWLALQSNLTGVLNIATGVPETLRNLIEYIEAAGEKPAQVYNLPEREGDIRISCAAIQAATEQLQFTASVNLKQGIAEMMKNASE